MDIPDILTKPALSGYALAIWNTPLPIDVLNFRGREALSEPFSYVIEVTSPLADIPPEQVLNKFASFRMQPNSFAETGNAQSGKNVHGIVSHFTRLSTSADETRYSVTVAPRLALLANSARCAVYQNLSVPEVVEQVLRRHGLEGADFEFRLERTYPDRELITQWRETDLEFIQRILAEVGIWWRFEMDNGRELEVMIFGDSQMQYVFGVTLPYKKPDGFVADGQECVWGGHTKHSIVSGKVHNRDYNYRHAGEPMDAVVSVRSQAVTTGETYHYGEPYLNAGDDRDPEPETESGAFYARIRHERLLNGSAKVQLLSNAMHLAPGQVLEPDGFPAPDFDDGILMTLVTFIGARDSQLQTSVWGQPYTERYGFRPACADKPEISGTIPARVESPVHNDIYAWLDNQGRYRVRVDFDRNDSERGYAYLWLRLARPYAGDTYGWHSPLLDGTEVGLTFHFGDPDRPYISEVRHDSEHPDVVTDKNHTRNVLRTPANNKLRMEDRRNNEHIKLATEYGKTQFNAGHIVDSQNQERGTGFELRTDEYGVIRVTKGLFITADGQSKGVGEALDRQTVLNEIEITKNKIQALNECARQSQALEADIRAQIAMFEERLKPIKQTILAHAPQGVALTSGEHLQLVAKQNVIANAGGDGSVGVVKNLTVQTGEQLGVFAHKGGISLKASEGKVDVQAQNNTMSLTAKGKISLTAIDGDLLLSAKKRIVLVGGGSYLILQQGGIEYGTQHDYLRYTGHTVLTVPETMPIQAVNGGGICLSCLMKAAMSGDTMVIRGQS